MIQGSITFHVKDDISLRRCVLCGKGYEYCRCKCSWCGAPKWRKEGSIYIHHVCKGGKN